MQEGGIPGPLCGSEIGLDRRALFTVVYIHETAHAFTHLGRDLEGRRWEDFGLPSSADPDFQPSALHEGLAQYFTFRLLEKLQDDLLYGTFDGLTNHQPPEYQSWRRMRDLTIEDARAILVRARQGLRDSWLA